MQIYPLNFFPTEVALRSLCASSACLILLALPSSALDISGSMRKPRVSCC